MKAAHITELRSAVDAVRNLAGIGNANWEDGTLAGSPNRTLIKAEHVRQ